MCNQLNNKCYYSFHICLCCFISSDEDSDVEISDVLTPEKRNVLDFFQNATPKELELMMSCSKKKAEAIIEYRPFEGWVDLVRERMFFKITLLEALFFLSGTKATGEQKFKH